MKISTPILPRKENLTSIDINILDFINNYDKNEFLLKQKELAEIIYTSEASISRFIRKYDFDSYKKFQLYINNKIQRNNLLIDSIVNNNELDFSNLHKIQSYAIESSINRDNIVKINRIAHMIDSSKKILVFGLGTSNKIAGEFSSNLRKIGKFAIYEPDFHVVFPILGTLEENDLVIFFTNNFLNPEVFFVIEIAKKFNAKIVVITSNEESSIDHLIDVKLIYSKIHDETKLVPIASKISQFIIVDYIFQYLITLNPNYKKQLNQANEVLNMWRKFLEK